MEVSQPFFTKLFSDNMSRLLLLKPSTHFSVFFPGGWSMKKLSIRFGLNLLVTFGKKRHFPFSFSSFIVPFVTVIQNSFFVNFKQAIVCNGDLLMDCCWFVSFFLSFFLSFS
jgi:hypothetical protein